MHITLKFLGATTLEKMAALKGSAGALAAGAASKAAPGSFSVDIGSGGTFSKGGPSVLWVKPDGGGAEDVVALGQAVRTSLEDAGFKKEPAFTSPHITLGRVRQKKLKKKKSKAQADPPGNPGGAEDEETDAEKEEFKQLVKAVQEWKFEPPMRLAVEKVVLMKSDLFKTGPVYTEVASFPLKDAS
eukprot:TRINITY_DN39918_c0_g1_i2.p2 TRINITY_DN39918_c0_g1~~TRINITY_DN39918_c0_g1_i2.p2  ORF type:complete len:186 (-),score=60.45 TRINITY_DN39918_c0_g1_i2:685-1242(-)